MKRPGSPNALEALQAASYILWVLSGRRWSGIRTTTELYVCEHSGACGGSGCRVQQIELREGHVVPLWSGERPDDFTGFSGLFLRQRPVREVLGVRRQGEVLDPAGFAVYDRAFIAPTSESCYNSCFDPCCLEVTYTWGTPPPALGKLAVVALADQLVNSVECPDECTLPERVTSVSRQGVSFQVFDPQDFMQDGRVGIYAVDMFLKAVNPDRAQKRARVFSVDMPSARRQTFPPSGFPEQYGRWGRG
jgi:hypothetical protein